MLDAAVVMTRELAQFHTDEAKKAAALMGAHLLEVKHGAGWIALGYDTWTAYLRMEFAFSRKHLYELMSAAPVIERLSPLGYTVNTSVANALSKYAPELQPVIAQATQARYGRLTESNVNRVGEVLRQVVVTGHVDTGSGTSTPLDAALSIEDDEANKRRQQYRDEKSQWQFVKAIEGECEMAPGVTFPGVYTEDFDVASYSLELGRQYRVVIYARKQAAP